MSWRDWIGYPGMLEDQNMASLIEILGKNIEHNKVVMDAVLRLQERVINLEEILKTHGLAK